MDLINNDILKYIQKGEKYNTIEKDKFNMRLDFQRNKNVENIDYMDKKIIKQFDEITNNYKKEYKEIMKNEKANSNIFNDILELIKKYLRILFTYGIFARINVMVKTPIWSNMKKE